MSSGFLYQRWIGCMLGLAVVAQAYAADAPDANEVVVSQGTATVTFGDVDAYVGRMPADVRPGFMNSPQRIEAMLLNLLQQQQMAVEARKLGLDKQPAVQEAIGKGGDVNAALAVALREHLTDTLVIPDFNELAHERYLANPRDFTQPGRIDVEQILIAKTGRTESEARELATAVHAKAAANPDQFTDLVAQYSDDPGKATSKGYLEDAASGQLDRNYAFNARKLKSVGDVSAVFEDRAGYHILRLVARQPDIKQSFEDVREEMIGRMRREYIRTTVADQISQFRSNTLDANPERVASLRERYMPAEEPSATAPKQ